MNDKITSVFWSQNECNGVKETIAINGNPEEYDSTAQQKEAMKLLLDACEWKQDDRIEISKKKAKNEDSYIEPWYSLSIKQPNLLNRKVNPSCLIYSVFIEEDDEHRNMPFKFLYFSDKTKIDDKTLVEDAYKELKVIISKLQNKRTLIEGQENRVLKALEEIKFKASIKKKRLWLLVLLILITSFFAFFTGKSKEPITQNHNNTNTTKINNNF